MLRARAADCQDTVLMLRGSGHPQDMETGGRPQAGVCAAADVHYLSAGGVGGTRGGSRLAAGAAFAHVLAGRTAVLSRVPPCRPGEFCLRELPPPRSWTI